MPLLAGDLAGHLAAILLKWSQHFFKGLLPCGEMFFITFLLWPLLSHPVMGVSSWNLHHLKTHIQGIQKRIRKLHTSTASHSTSLWRRKIIKLHSVCRFSKREYVKFSRYKGTNINNIKYYYLQINNFYFIIFILNKTISLYKATSNISNYYPHK